MPKTKKPPTRTALKKKADRLWSQVVRQRGKCERCGRRPPEVVLQGAHIIPRRYLKTRFDPENGFSLCSSDHVYFTHYPLEFEAFCIEKLGEERFADLKSRAMSTSHKIDYEAVIWKLEELMA